VLGYRLSNLIFNGPDEELKLTYNTQPALVTVSLAIWEVIKDRLTPDYFAGHSLGEYTAIVAAGGMSFEDATLAVHNRGKFMQEAVPVGVGTMAAVLGMDEELVVETCKEISRECFVVEPANFNSSGQIVVAGHLEAIDEFIKIIKEKAQKRL